MSCRLSHCITLAILVAFCSQASRAEVDFARDVKPLFEKHCFECHGAKTQKNGFRLDRRSRAMAGVVRPNIIPGMSSSSRVYRRVLEIAPDHPDALHVSARILAYMALRHAFPCERRTS